MPRKRALRIHLETGLPKGLRVAGIARWEGIAVLAHRRDMKTMLEREELGRGGMFVRRDQLELDWTLLRKVGQCRFTRNVLFQSAGDPQADGSEQSRSGARPGGPLALAGPLPPHSHRLRRPAHALDGAAAAQAQSCRRVPRPSHLKTDPAVQRRFKKDIPSIVRRSLPLQTAGRKTNVWIQDEAPIGQQGNMTRVWAEKGSCPRAQRNIRRESLCLFGASCARRGGAAGMIGSKANTEVVNLHLDEIFWHAVEGSYAAALLDQAGWRLNKALLAPENLMLLSIPSYSPELNSMEPVWKHLRANEFAPQLWNRCKEIERTVMDTWNRCANNPGLIASITGRAWITVDA